MKLAMAAPPPPAQPEPEPTGRIKFEIRDLDLRFDQGKCHALTGITMDIRANAVTAIIGPSGCGKSSLIKCLNRMHEKTRGTTFELAGKVLLDGEEIYSPHMDATRLRTRVGMIFQQPNPFPKSVYENVVYGPRLGGIRRREELDGIVEQALRQANLWQEAKDILQRSALSLSGGQQQRLCIARVLATNPEVILWTAPVRPLIHPAHNGSKTGWQATSLITPSSSSPTTSNRHAGFRTTPPSCCKKMLECREG